MYINVYTHYNTYSHKHTHEVGLMWNALYQRQGKWERGRRQRESVEDGQLYHTSEPNERL